MMASILSSTATMLRTRTRFKRRGRCYRPSLFFLDNGGDMRNDIKNLIVLVIFVVGLLYVIKAYDVRQDPSMHAHTQECVTEGCPFEEVP
jgi:hypothetical protein